MGAMAGARGNMLTLVYGSAGDGVGWVMLPVVDGVEGVRLRARAIVGSSGGLRLIAEGAAGLGIFCDSWKQ